MALKYKLFNTFKHLTILGLLLTALMGCSDDDNNNASTTPPPLMFEAPFTGSRQITATAFQNTITLNWNQPEHETLTIGDYLYKIYFSDQDNIQTLEDVLANGILLDGFIQDRDSYVIRGFQNSTRYYANIVIRNSGTNEAIGAFQSVAIDTGVGPTLTSFDVTSGDAEAIGTGLNSIWGPTATVFTYDAPCDPPAISGTTDFPMSNFNGDVQQDTFWTSSEPGAVSVNVNRCMSFCDSSNGNFSNSNSVCTNAVIATEQ